MPHFTWKEDDMAHSLLFFPFVGAVIGALICLVNLPVAAARLPVAVRILLTLAIPLIITGGIHVDGFLDTEDALHSYASMHRKLEILKDPHVGAFALISFLKWILILGAAISAILLNARTDFKMLLIFGLSFVVTRCLSGLTSLLFRKAKTDGMLYEETKKQSTAIFFLGVQLLVSGTLMVYLNALCGALLLLALGLFTCCYRHRTYKEFGGVTGDTAGYYLTVCELLGAVILAAWGGISQMF
ncbi:MAG: adenosylcobinamide-GDP ribazoletransferase [Lachnospiraceae bacterium]|nr:adenosylcobinamide-GDP ribazoletransferase [Lachnospiraceae bacterium]